MEIDTEVQELRDGDGEPIRWDASVRTDHGIFGGSGPTRYAAELNAMAKAAEEDPEAAYELKEMLREGPPHEPEY